MQFYYVLQECCRSTAEEMCEREPYIGPVLKNIKVACLSMITTQGMPKHYAIGQLITCFIVPKHL